MIADMVRRMIVQMIQMDLQITLLKMLKRVLKMEEMHTSQLSINFYFIS